MRRLFPVTEETAARTPEATGGASAAEVATADGGEGSAGAPTADVRDGDSPAAAGKSDLSGMSGLSGASGLSDLVEREWSLDELAAAYAYPDPAPGGREPWLRANMVSTLDGAAQHGGRSQPISSDADMRIFGTLRGLADVVIVGAETVRQEGYRPARAREAFAEARRAAGQTPAPAVAVVSASLDLDFSLPLFTSPLTPTLLLTGAAAAPDRVATAEKAGVRVVVAGDGMGVDPARAVRALADLGMTRLLTEGGPRILGQLVAADVLDELCLTVSPMLTAGDAQRIAGGPSVAVPKRFALASLLEESGFLFGRYRRT
ncbi:pyrimidine reductase family protein [Streptomyces sp. SP18BB07]|uniref:pyrimidine reductase family protein n=1 Tax=Streptomyces sp. SP18BB07 TaxID=3002522 RepID=UPI003FCD1013